MEPDRELVEIYEVWVHGPGPNSSEAAQEAHDELVNLLEHLHSHGWAIVRRLGGTNG